ncbi:MAG: glycosyltransferase family 9 protein [Candidatus Omnitrophica bacterium]|nr:glycosyltransferase family 9 protein [Candidatus Omnitrophota bacterium]
MLLLRGKIAGPRKILVIRVDHIGDVINSTVVIKPLRKNFPHAKIDFLAPAWGMDIVKNNYSLNNVFEFTSAWFTRTPKTFFDNIRSFFRMVRIIRNGRYDVCIDLRGDVRHIFASFIAGVPVRISYGITGCGFLLTHIMPYKKGIHETMKNILLLEPLGIKGGERRLELIFPERDGMSAKVLLQKFGVRGKYAVFHVTPGHDNKRWDMEKFTEVMEYLRTYHGITSVLVGSSDNEKEAMEFARGTACRVPAISFVDIVGKTRLGELYNILKDAALFVGIDSAPAHLAAAAGIPVILLFSEVNDPAEWAPEGANVNVIYPAPGEKLADIPAHRVCELVLDSCK